MEVANAHTTNSMQIGTLSDATHRQIRKILFGYTLIWTAVATLATQRAPIAAAVVVAGTLLITSTKLVERATRRTLRYLSQDVFSPPASEIRMRAEHGDVLAELDCAGDAYAGDTDPDQLADWLVAESRIEHQNALDSRNSGMGEDDEAMARSAAFEQAARLIRKRPSGKPGPASMTREPLSCERSTTLASV